MVIGYEGYRLNFLGSRGIAYVGIDVYSFWILEG